MKHNPMVRRTLKRRTHWPDRQSAYASFHERGVFRGWHEEALMAYVEHGLHEKSDGLHLLAQPWLEASVYARYANSIWPTIKKVSVPCHVIIGNKTFPYLQAGLNRACKLNQYVTQEVMPGAHCFMQEHPQAVGERVLLRLRESGAL
jgi:pimeloyl-ACP methyl ester carboxylesterase